jgi:hypothetical protein
LTDNRKTIVAAGVLAAAVGVYLEISFQEKLKTTERAGQASGVARPSPSASASTAPSASAPPQKSPRALP